MKSTRLAFAHRRRDVFAINQGIRLARKFAGELEEEMHFETKYGTRAFASGDRLLFTEIDRSLDVRNGVQATVGYLTDSEITVRFDKDINRQPHLLTFSVKHYNSIDHGYAKLNLFTYLSICPIFRSDFFNPVF